MKLRIAYYTEGNIQVIDLDADEWVESAPNGILKLLVKTETGWREYFGLNSYVVRKEGANYYVGGIHNTKFSDEKGVKIDPPLESLINAKPDTKFGVAIPTRQWIEFQQRDLTYD